MQSTTRYNEGHAHQVDLKGILGDAIMTYKEKESTSLKIINCNARLYHESGGSGKHGVWSHKDLQVGMHLKGLHGVTNVGIRIRPWGGRHKTRKDDASKCLD